MSKLSVKPQAKNANRHTQRGMQALETSIATDGWIGAITVAADGETFDGSARVEKTAENGMLTNPIVVESDGQRPIVVVRTDIPTATDPRAVRLGIAANRVASLNLEWEPDVLKGIADSGIDLSSLFTADEWADVSMPSLPEAGGGGDEFDPTPEDGPTRTHLGELWQIGGVHRLLVGDCTDPANVARLMGGERANMVWTDPPYNVDAAGSTRDARDDKNYGKGARIENDAMSDEAFTVFLQSAFHSMDSVLQDGAAFYIAHPDRYSLEFRLVIRDLGWHCPQTIIWVKENFVFGRNDYHPQHEQVLYGWKGGAAHHAVADRTQSTVWQIDVGGRHEDHPTEKPLELVRRAIENSSKLNALVIDFFAGSGVTLTAVHRTGRRCYGMEIAPRYADVILRRAEAEGLKCTLIDD